MSTITCSCGSGLNLQDKLWLPVQTQPKSVDTQLNDFALGKQC